MSQLLWTQTQDIGPAPRSGAAMVYDSGKGRIVLFGGQAADNATALNDTWEWDGENWTQYTDIGPAPRSLHAMAYDSNRGRIVLFGGVANNHITRFNDTWEWDGEAWTQVADAGPARRSAAAMAYDSKRGRALLFGGYDGNYRNNVWELAWGEPVSVTGEPDAVAQRFELAPAIQGRSRC